MEARDLASPFEGRELDLQVGSASPDPDPAFPCSFPASQPSVPGNFP